MDKIYARFYAFVNKSYMYKSYIKAPKPKPACFPIFSIVPTVSLIAERVYYYMNVQLVMQFPSLKKRSLRGSVGGERERQRGWLFSPSTLQPTLGSSEYTMYNPIYRLSFPHHLF